MVQHGRLRTRQHLYIRVGCASFSAVQKQGNLIVIADYIDEFIMICAGLWMTGIGFGFLAFPAEAKPGQHAWWIHLVGHFKWMGPLFMLIAIVLAVASQP